MYEIEKNVPVPPSIGKWDRLFSAMAVGDSFKLPLNEKLKARSAAGQYVRRKTGRKFTVREVDGVVRCWRIA